MKRLLPPSTGYVLRVLLAVALSIYAAYWLELDSPYSAGTTTLIVVNASRGAILSKSLWRVSGTLVGAVAAVAVMAVCAQAPVLFVMAMAAWIGLCTALSSVLRYFRSYGAVLAGYTITLVAFGALDHPDRIFDLAVARLAVVTIGVISPAVVATVFDRGPLRTELEDRLASLIAAAARLVLDALHGGDTTALTASRSRIAADLAALDQVVEYASSEDAGSRFAGDLRFAAAELFAALTGGLRAAELLRRVEIPDPAPACAGLGAELAAALAHVASLRPGTAPALAAELAPARVRLAARMAGLHDVPALAALGQATALLDQFGVALDALAALRSGRPQAAPPRLRVYVNPVTAARNGARAALAVAIAGLFWIVSAWPSGGTMIAMLGPICGLLAQSESASAASVDFLIGTLLAAVAAFVCTFGVLPQMSGFPLLMLGFLPFVAAGVVGTTYPRVAGVATAYLIFFVTLTGPTNPMRFDLAAFLNNAFAFVIGAACGVLTFRVLLPPDPRREARVLARSIRADLGRLAAGRSPLGPLAWEHLQHQKLVRLSRRLAGDPVRRAAAIRDGEGALRVGRRITELRAGIGQLDPGRAAALAGPLQAARRLLAAPAETADAAARAAGMLAAPDEFGPAPPPALHAAAALHDLSELLRERAALFAAHAAVA